MATQAKSILHTQIIFQKDLVWLIVIGRLSIKTTITICIHCILYIFVLLVILEVGFMWWMKATSTG